MFQAGITKITSDGKVAATAVPTASTADYAPKLVKLTKPLIWSWELKTSINENLARLTYEPSFKNLFIGGLYYAFSVIKGATPVAYSCRDNGGTWNEVKQDQTLTTAETKTGGESTHLRSLIPFANSGGFKNVLVDLVMPLILGNLRTSNVDSYFKMIDVPLTGDDVWSHISSLATHLQDLRLDSSSYSTISESKWRTYHYGKIGVGGLFMKMRSELEPAMGAAFTSWFGASQVSNLELLKAEPWNVAASSLVTQRSLFLIAGWMKATRAYPENWYMGDKAWEAGSGVMRTKVIAIFRRAVELMANTDGVETASADELAAMINGL
jgi:hypothetical protein